MSAIKRHILITGSTDGIGRQAALELCQNPQNYVIIHGRNERRCEQTLAYIEGEQGRKPTNIDFVVADFGRMSEVANMATEVERRFPKLNTLVCNAGVIPPTRQLSDDGLELGFQVNHLAHFFLTNKLLGLLKRNAKSRVVLVSSICHDWYGLDFDDLHCEKHYERYEQYARTKLMNHLFCFALQRRLDGAGVTSNVLEPGVIDTKLFRSFSEKQESVQFLTDTVGRPDGAAMPLGARTMVYLAQSDDVIDTTGEYFNNDKTITEPCKASRDVNLQERLWDVSVGICRQMGYEI